MSIEGQGMIGDILNLRKENERLTAENERLRQLLREAYGYLPMAISLAEELAAMFPDIARPQDR